MWYAIISQDIAESLPLRKIHRPAHVARLQKLDGEGRVLIAGPHPTGGPEDGFTGSLVVADFPSFEEAQDWANQDPYLLNGIYQDVCVKPFTKVFPAG